MDNRDRVEAMEHHRAPGDEDKRSEASPPGDPQPIGTEVESARLLANKTHDQLEAAGLSPDEVLDLAERFIADHPNADPSAFVDWAKQRR